jgi:hypothetical protein
MMNHLAKRQQEEGSVLMVSLFIAFLFGMFLFSYLYLVRNQNMLVRRSQAWNSALTLAEAGAEEALAQLNPGAPQPVIDRTANGWGAVSGGMYGPVSRSLAAGSYSVVYTDDTFPIIYSTGYVTIPYISATLTRTIRLATTNVALFTAGMASRTNIDFKGNGVYTDSFDSQNPSFSTNGRYDASKASTNGDVGSIFGLVNVGNGDIHGKLLLGPTAAGSVGPNGLVTGGMHNDFNMEFEDVVLPATTWLPVSPLAVPIVIGGVSYDYVFLINGDYSVFKPSGNMYVGTNVTVRLLVTGTASPSNIRVAGSGSSAGNLAIYMNGPSFTLSGASSVDGGSALNLAYYGTTNNTQVTFGGNASFTGTIYAPEANVKLGGGGNNSYDFAGSLFADSVTVNGHYSFHFDEALLRAPPVRLVARSWQEL